MLGYTYRRSCYEVDGGIFQQDGSNPEEMIILGKLNWLRKEIIFGDPN